MSTTKSPYDIFADLAGRDLADRILRELDDAGWQIIPQPSCLCGKCDPDPDYVGRNVV